MFSMKREEGGQEFDLAPIYDGEAYGTGNPAKKVMIA